MFIQLRKAFVSEVAQHWIWHH